MTWCFLCCKPSHTNLTQPLIGWWSEVISHCEKAPKLLYTYYTLPTCVVILIVAVGGVCEELCAKSRHQGQGQVITSHRYCGMWLLDPAPSIPVFDIQVLILRSSKQVRVSLLSPCKILSVTAPMHILHTSHCTVDKVLIQKIFITQTIYCFKYVKVSRGWCELIH